MPGVDGPGGSFGLPEGLSIPVTAKHKAAAAAFIEWWERPENAIAIYKTAGQPALRRVRAQAAGRQRRARRAATSSRRSCPTSARCSRQGAPIWYSQFSSDAQGLLNAAVKGDISVADALNQLREKAAARSQ